MNLVSALTSLESTFTQTMPNTTQLLQLVFTIQYMFTFCLRKHLQVVRSAGCSLLRRTQCHSLETTCNRCYWRKLSAATRNAIIEHFLFLGGFSISIPNLDFEQTNLGKRRPWCQTFFHVIKSYQVKSQLNIWFGL